MSQQISSDLCSRPVHSPPTSSLPFHFSPSPSLARPAPSCPPLTSLTHSLVVRVVAAPRLSAARFWLLTHARFHVCSSLDAVAGVTVLDRCCSAPHCTMGDMSDFSPRLARPHLLTALALPPHCIRRALIVRSLSLTLPLSLPLCPGFRRCSIPGLGGQGLRTHRHRPGSDACER